MLSLLVSTVDCRRRCCDDDADDADTNVNRCRTRFKIDAVMILVWIVYSIKIRPHKQTRGDLLKNIRCLMMMTMMEYYHRSFMNRKFCIISDQTFLVGLFLVFFFFSFPVTDFVNRNIKIGSPSS